MENYIVTWEIEVQAKGPKATAREALDCIVNGSSRVFTVRPAGELKREAKKARFFDMDGDRAGQKKMIF